jgi:hypothetical protein
VLPLWRPRHEGRAFALALHDQLRTRLSKAEMRKFEWHGKDAHALSAPRFGLWSRGTSTGRIRRFQVHSSQNASPLVVQCPDLHAYCPGTRIAWKLSNPKSSAGRRSAGRSKSSFTWISAAR